MMPGESVCPRCHSRLLVDAETTEPTVTCPGCLASIRNPRYCIQPEPAPRPLSTPMTLPTPDPGREAAPRFCPVCAEIVEPSWRSCPHCSASLREGGNWQSSPASAGLGANRNFAPVGLMLIGVGLIGVVGYVLLLVNEVIRFNTFDQFFTATLVVGCLVTVLMVTGIVLGVRKNSEGASIFTGIFGGLALGLTIGLLALVFVVGIVVFAFISCARECEKSRKKQDPQPPAKVAPR